MMADILKFTETPIIDESIEEYEYHEYEPISGTSPNNDLITYHPYRAIQSLIRTRHGSKLSQVFLSNMSYEYVLLFFTIIIIVIGCYGWK